jgi:hypothetical protein
MALKAMVQISTKTRQHDKPSQPSKHLKTYTAPLAESSGAIAIAIAAATPAAALAPRPPRPGQKNPRKKHQGGGNPTTRASKQQAIGRFAPARVHGHEAEARRTKSRGGGRAEHVRAMQNQRRRRPRTSPSEARPRWCGDDELGRVETPSPVFRSACGVVRVQRPPGARLGRVVSGGVSDGFIYTYK